MDKKDLAKYLDLANHRSETTPWMVEELCQRVKTYGFHSAFVNPVYVPLARGLLGEEGLVGTVIAFPLGQEMTSVKLSAVEAAVKAGADELDVLMNIGWFKAGQHSQVLDEMKKIVALARQQKIATVVKFIIETGLLTEKEIKRAAELVVESGAHFVKTCSGWGPRGAQVKDVELIKAAIGNRVKIKAAGGIHTSEQAVKFIEAGASRIGTSKAVEIVSD